MRVVWPSEAVCVVCGLFVRPRFNARYCAGVINVYVHRYMYIHTFIYIHVCVCVY